MSDKTETWRDAFNRPMCGQAVDCCCGNDCDLICRFCMTYKPCDCDDRDDTDYYTDLEDDDER